MSNNVPFAGLGAPERGNISVLLVITLALQSAVGPFATDMYTPSLPQVTKDLHTISTALGITLTALFVGMTIGQLVGGPISDQLGRRMPMIAGGICCAFGGALCAQATSVQFLVAARLLQGFGGGLAAVVAFAVVIDLAHGDELARVMSLLMVLGGTAPAIAPVIGAGIITVGTWRHVFWVLTGFGLLMVITAALLVPETLPKERRHSGGITQLGRGLWSVISIRPFLAWTLIAAFSSFAMMGYISNASFYLQGMKGLRPLAFSLFFAGTAITQVVLSIINSRLVVRLKPAGLVEKGTQLVVTAALVILVGSVAFSAPLVTTCIGFVVLMGMQAFIYGNANALGALHATHAAGSASAAQGVATGIALSTAAPLASSGGTRNAVPMSIVILLGAIGALLACRWAQSLQEGRRQSA